MKKYFALTVLMLCWLMCAACCFEYHSYWTLLGMTFSWLCLVFKFFGCGLCDMLLGAILVAFLFWCFLKFTYRNVGNGIVCAACLVLHLSGAWYIVLRWSGLKWDALWLCVWGSCALLSAAEILVCVLLCMDAKKSPRPSSAWVNKLTLWTTGIFRSKRACYLVACGIAIALAVLCCVWLDDDWCRGKPVCPADDFHLDANSVMQLEKEALLYGNHEAAERLFLYYSLSRGESDLGDVWEYRLAQLGGFQAAVNLEEKGKLCDPKSVFSHEVTKLMTETGMSELARSYVWYHYKHSRMDSVRPLDDYIADVRDLTLRPAEVKVRYVNCGSGPLDFEYNAYKTRQLGTTGAGREPSAIVVFPESPAPYSMPSGRSVDGVACQNAVTMSEELGLGWIVVSVAPSDELIRRVANEEVVWYKRLPAAECGRCVELVLRDVFKTFSLAPKTAVIFAGNSGFANSMSSFAGDSFVVQPAPACLLTGNGEK